MNDITKQSELVSYIEGLKHVRLVNQSEEAAKTLGNVNKLVSYVSIAIIALLLIISIFLISNTVSVGIAVRKEEIGIMKYIGATDAFVRAPFLLEGIVLGVIGAAIPLVGLYFCYNAAVSYILNKFNVLTGVVDFIPGMADLPDIASYRTGTWNRNRTDRKFLYNKKAFKSIIKSR